MPSSLTRSEIAAAYRSHGPAVRRRARHILGNDADAVEVLQEVFTSLLDRPEQFAATGSLMAFLYRATTNRCLNRLRNVRTRQRLLDQRGPQSEGAPALAERRALASDLLARLPEDQARALIYYSIDEMSQAEIADLMGCSRRHIGNLLERARASVAAECGDPP